LYSLYKIEPYVTVRKDGDVLKKPIINICQKISLNPIQ
jgi:hypothetical protein